jgi:S1-C subfamily serine protease
MKWLWILYFIGTNQAEKFFTIIMEDELEMLTHASPQWEETLSRTIPCIVSIRSISVRSFDTDSQRTSQATGFVVDSELGIILSNRHVVQPGPILADGIFNKSKEEAKLTPIYRDPVHDFGFFKFDPTDLKYMKVESIPLKPWKARVGLEIRVVGNDNGEKLSILAGTLARLDRNAPNYGAGSYNDWNTFYFQASSMTSGGSSGSPVIDCDGNAVALNAGGATKAATSFFLPLDRVVRALEYIRRGEQVPRGTIQTILEYRPYDEIRRLGLPQDTEALLRASFKSTTGMLTVQHVIPKGPAYEKIMAGDILLKINNNFVIDFVSLESMLDGCIGQTINVTVQRKEYINPEEIQKKVLKFWLVIWLI